MPKPKLSPSAFAVLLVCAVTCYKGANLILFLSGAARVEAALAESSAGAREPAHQFGMSLSEHWKNYSGVADRARSLKLTIAVDAAEADEAAVEIAIAEIVDNSPTRDMTWLDLADSRLARGEATESVLAAVRMSSLVGSHEGETMVRRAVFGLEYWNSLPQADRQNVVRDMAQTEVSPDPPPSPWQQYRQILDSKSAIERKEILTALIASGLVSSDLIQALGG